MRRRSACRGIKIHRNYSVEEAARALGIAKGTVRRWIKTGLPALRDQKPNLILGADLADFLRDRAKPKQRCQPHECYCVKCRAPRAPAEGMAEFVQLSPTGGNLRALCPTCAAIMHRRVSLQQLATLVGILDVTMVQVQEHLTDSVQPCANDHILKESVNHA